MDMIAWLVLVLVAGGVIGGIAFFLRMAGKSENTPPRPVWQVLLEGGINGRADDRPDDEPRDEPHDGPDEPGSGTTQKTQEARKATL